MRKIKPLHLLIMTFTLLSVWCQENSQGKNEKNEENTNSLENEILNWNDIKTIDNSKKSNDSIFQHYYSQKQNTKYAMRMTNAEEHIRIMEKMKRLYGKPEDEIAFPDSTWISKGIKYTRYIFGLESDKNHKYGYTEKPNGERTYVYEVDPNMKFEKKISSKEKSPTLKDSISVLQSDTLKILKLVSGKLKDSISATRQTGYHIINYDKANITLNVFDDEKKRWKKTTLQYYSTLKDKGTIEFNTDPNICQKVYLDIAPFNSIIYAFDSNSVYMFSNVKKIDNSSLDSLGIYNWVDSFQFEQKTKEIVIKEKIKGFEYSEHWRKEAYKKVIGYMNQHIDDEDPNCKIISRGYYNPNLVRYIGNQGYKVKFYCEFDCNQNYINQSYFWVEAYYLGHGKWDLEVIDRKLAH
ncbi:hypothetical protein [Sinomicrobium oceani]|uniref:hypothetical protein n=1 Tax=Sinomicrobium oceani TaxID=1150368 RepID=UPI00227CD028|nr:hypothetical protein [Sinomicrobium oceani]